MGLQMKRPDTYNTNLIQTKQLVWGSAVFSRGGMEVPRLLVGNWYSV